MEFLRGLFAVLNLEAIPAHPMLSKWTLTQLIELQTQVQRCCELPSPHASIAQALRVLVDICPRLPEQYAQLVTKPLAWRRVVN